MALAYIHDIESALDTGIGEGGLSTETFGQLTQQVAPALERLNMRRAAGELAFLDMPDARDDLAAMATLAARFRGAFDTVLVLGTGGSSLGGRAVAALADRGFGPPAGAPTLHFLDNVDPDTFTALFQRLDPARTGVFAISKSGGTAETLCQLAILIDHFRRNLGDSAPAQHIAVMTEPKVNPLAALAEQHGLTRIDHDPKLGGRFSVMQTAVVPAMLLGLDVSALRAAAAEVTEATLTAARAEDAVPAIGAVLQVGLAHERGVSQSVLMPYCDRLFWFARWYRQLWAESLGKQGRGTTPIDAVGTVDQHSQLQLYLDGPADKLFTILRITGQQQEPTIDPAVAGHPDLGYLHGRRMGELFDAEARATAETLINRGRPVRRMSVETLDAGTLGALFQHFMLETAIAAELLGVDAYDQPAVEEGKRLTRQYLSA